MIRPSTRILMGVIGALLLGLWSPAQAQEFSAASGGRNAADQAGESVTEVAKPGIFARFRGAVMNQRTSENDVVDDANFRADYLSSLIFSRTNEVRQREGLPALVRNRGLEAVATAHSSDMASRNYFSHITKGLLSRPDLGARLHSGGVGYTKAAENIAMYPVVVRRLYEISSVGLTPRRVEVGRQGITYGDMAAKVMDGWMKSPGHRSNILDPSLAELGVGCAVGIRKECSYVYLTQNFRR